MPYYFLHHLLKRFSLGAKTTARFLLIDKKGFSVGLCVLSINKNEHPKGFGALEDCPNKKMRSTYLPEALHLLDRREVYKTTQKKLLGLLVAISHNVPLAWRSF